MKKLLLAGFAAVIEGMIDVVGVSDMEGRITQINTAVEAWGYKKEELIGKPVVEVLAKRSLPKLKEEKKETLVTGATKNLELVGLKRDGSEFPVLVNVSLMKDAEGKPIGRIFSLRDITELKRAEDEVEAARDYTENIIKSMLDTLIVVDPEAKIKTINRATSDLLGYKEDELIGKPVATIFEEEVTLFKGTRMKKLIEEGSIRDYDMTYMTKSGEKIPVSFSGSVMRETSPSPQPSPTGGEAEKVGRIIGIVGIARDMREIRRLMQREKEALVAAVAAETEKKRAEGLQALNQQLRASEQQLKAANQQLRASEQQLKAANQQLRAKEQALRSSQEELRNKIVNVERFNRFMVGRELEMVRLKEEVNSLLEKLGQPKKYEAPEKIKGTEGVG